MREIAPNALHRTAGPRPGTTPVDKVFKVLFSKFSVSEWPNFVSDVQGMFALGNAKTVSSATRNLFRGYIEDADLANPPADEAAVPGRLFCGVLKPLNRIQRAVSAEQSSRQWDMGSQSSLAHLQSATPKRPDFTYPAAAERPMIVGKVKEPPVAPE